MDIGKILDNSKGGAGATGDMNTEHQLHAQLIQAAAAARRSPSEPGSDRDRSPRDSGQASLYSSKSHHRIQPLVHSNGNQYPSPSALPLPLPMLQTGFASNSMYEGNSMNSASPTAHQISAGESHQRQFPCSTCGKGFARRSDLARHERIHSGVRPHVCDYPNCGKQFIQRSALTVHTRVHTREKPHMCEKCGKFFSDSSSLARHRRIHSGKRPYQCPYADCQKTFTRRTTLTRHQNHHTGTVEEAAAATAAILATRQGTGRQSTKSESGTYSNTGSTTSTPSPGQRHLSMSPSADMLPPPGLHQSNYAYMSNGSLPPHLRGGGGVQDSPRSSPSGSQTSLPSLGGHRQPAVTSHPSNYGPLPVLEPSPNMDSRQPRSGSASPHHSMGWQSPSHHSIGSPSHSQEQYVYPDPYGTSAAPHLYSYPSSNMRRPQSTDPNDSYEHKARVQGSDGWAPPIS